MSYDMTRSEANYEYAELEVERVYCKHESCIELLTDEQATICDRCKEPFCAGHIYEVVSGESENGAVRFYCSFCEDVALDVMDQAEGEYRECDKCEGVGRFTYEGSNGYAVYVPCGRCNGIGEVK